MKSLLFSKLLGQQQADMSDAENYSEWRHAAIAHDEASGGANWRKIEQTRLYDYAAIRFRLQRLKGFRDSGDDHGLLYALDEGVHGNLARMGNRSLYSRSMFGTKLLIEQYIGEVCEALNHLAHSNVSDISRAEKLDFFRRASLCYGRSALLLSGGGVYGNFHIGVIRALLAENLLPRVISGSSAGALIAALVGSYNSEDLEQILQPERMIIAASDRSRSSNFLFPRYEYQDVVAHIDRLVPDVTFAEAFQKTGIHINISVSPAQQHQTSRLLNVITAPKVSLRSAVLASGSVPGIYPPAPLYAKDRHGDLQAYLPGRKWVDGSVSDDLPARRLSRLYGVNHFIVSMVNPIALLTSSGQAAKNWRDDIWQFWHHSAKNTARSMQSITEKYGQRWPNVSFNINSALSVFMQDYSGDINILPPAGMVNLRRGMRQPSLEYMADIINAGERATWPNIEMIRNCSRIGRVLDDILCELDPCGLDAIRQEVGAAGSMGKHVSKFGKGN